MPISYRKADRQHWHVLSTSLITESRRKDPPMNAKTETSKNVSRCDSGIGRLCEELNREDSELRSHLLDAALAGLQLTRHPESQDFRCEATKVWSAIEPVLSHHLAAEDSVMMLAWLERYG